MAVHLVASKMLGGGMRKIQVHYYYKKWNEKDKEALSHVRDETWHETELFCPNCRKQAVWREDMDNYLYYTGYQHLCCVCGARFQAMLGETSVHDMDSTDRERLRKLAL